MVMRPVIAALLALALLAGCGEAADDPAYGPGADPAASSSSPGAPAEPETVAILTGSDAGGEVSTQGTPLVDERAVDGFVAQFTGDGLASEVRAAYAGAGLPEGRVLVAAVVALGCEPPTEVVVETAGDGVRISAVPVKSDRQCLVAVTTVALVAVDGADL